MTPTRPVRPRLRPHHRGPAVERGLFGPEARAVTGDDSGPQMGRWFIENRESYAVYTSPMDDRSRQRDQRERLTTTSRTSPWNTEPVGRPLQVARRASTGRLDEMHPIESGRGGRIASADRCKHKTKDEIAQVSV